MRNKFKIILPDGSKYKPPERTMIVMNTDGIVFLATNNDWDCCQSLQGIGGCKPKTFKELLENS